MGVYAAQLLCRAKEWRHQVLESDWNMMGPPQMLVTSMIPSLNPLLSSGNKDYSFTDQEAEAQGG